MTTLGVAFNNTGSTRVAAGTLLLQPAFNNRGLIDLAAGATLAVANASFVNTGILQGNGLLRTAANGALLNNGVLAAGARLQVGALGLDGDLTMGGVGVLDVDLASLSSFDTLSVTDAVTLRGAVAVHGLAGYVPKVGEHFTVLTFNQRLAASTFDRVTWQGAGGVLLTAQYNLHDVTLTVVAVPEPATWALWLAGLVVGLGRGARQRAAARR